MRFHLQKDGYMYRYGIICLLANGIRSLVVQRLQDWTFAKGFSMFLSHSLSLPHPINTQPKCNNLTSHLLPMIRDCIICKPHFVFPLITVTWLASLLHIWEVWFSNFNPEICQSDIYHGFYSPFRQILEECLKFRP